MSRSLRLLSLIFALVFAACDAGEAQPEPDRLQVREVVLAAPDGTVMAYSHDDHWHGTVRVTAGASVPVAVWLIPAGAPATGHDTPPRSVWTRPSDHEGVSVRVTSDDAAVASWTGAGDTFTLSSPALGAALTTVVVLQGSTTVYQSPPAPTLSSPPVTGTAR